MKQFDEEFSRKAKEAFENYNADHLAGEGWDSWLRKQEKKRSLVIAFPLWTKVASIAVLVTAGVLFTARLNTRKTDEPAAQIAKETLNEQSHSVKTSEDTASATSGIKAAEPLITATNPLITNPSQTPGVAESKAVQAGKAVRSPLSKTLKTERFLSADADKDAGALLTDAEAVEGPLVAENSEVAKMSPEMNLPDNPLEIRLTDDTDTRLKLQPKEDLHIYSDIPREKMTTTIMTGLSGMIASVDNAASASQGISIGFYVEQQLSRRISIRPGLAMARHNYALESTSGGNIAMDYAAPELDGMAGTSTTYDADIDVVSMEVPVNFVFSLRKRARSNLFVTTGASTVFYLSQQISGNINNTYTRSTVDSYGKVSYESMTTSVMIESEKEPLSRVDILGLANFSAGYSFPFAKTSHLLFEPFVQLPVRDLTSLNLRIRYGGLSMKIQF